MFSYHSFLVDAKSFERTPTSDYSKLLYVIYMSISEMPVKERKQFTRYLKKGIKLIGSEQFEDMQDFYTFLDDNDL